MLVAAIALATLLQAVAVGRMADRGVFVKYPALADQLLSGTGGWDRLGDVSAAYLGSVVLARGLLGLSPHQIVTGQILLLGVVAAGLALLAWRHWGPVAAVATAVAVSGSRAALVNASELEPELLLMLLSSLGLGLAVVSTGRWGHAAAGVALGLAALTRPTVMLPAVAVAVVMVVARRRPTTSGWGAAAWLLGALVLSVAAGRGAVVLLPGATTPMNPGTVFFEGWNPNATGYQGEAPAVVKDVEFRLGVPDGLHPAYRWVASAAVGSDDAAATNLYWGRKALAFIAIHPRAALRLAARKVLNTIHAHESWDLFTMERRSRLMHRWPQVPFSILFCAAVAGAVVWRRANAAMILTAWAAASLAIPVLFYVTSRQRLMALPALAMLAGLAAAAAWTAWRSGRRRSVGIGLLAVLGVAMLLSVAWHPQREERHAWDLALRRERALAAAQAAENHDPRSVALIRAALALAEDVPVDPGTLRAAWRAEAATASSSAERFDLALVAASNRWWRDAEALLEDGAAAGYRPQRGARTASSVAYHLARCRLAAGDPVGASRRLERAGRELPGSAAVLALDAEVSRILGLSERSAHAEAELDRLHDPLTALQATASACDAIGDHRRALQLRARVREALPPD